MKSTLLKSGLVSLAIAMSSSIFAAEVHWDYDDSGLSGPSNWGTLSEEFALCGTGKAQSPINFISGTEVAAELKKLKTDYDSDTLNVQNNGHTIQVNMAPGSNIKTPTGKYALLQFHFHFKSEHTVDGVHAGLEAHFVHMNKNGELGVLGVFIDEAHNGKENEALATILRNAPHDLAINPLSTHIDIEDLLPDEKIKHFWHYNGSLTTPPCSEGVKWYVAQKRVHASAEQIEEMAALVHHKNNRPVQAINGRVIKTSTDDDSTDDDSTDDD